MIRPDYGVFAGRSSFEIQHSAKGSTWKEHKYIKRINGTYYYPASYEGGRHLKDGDDTGLSDDEKKEYDTSAENLTEEDIAALAQEVIRGNFGNGQTRKDLLGDNYQKVQDRVNQILLGGAGSTKISEVSKEETRELVTVVQKAVDNVDSSNKSWIRKVAEAAATQATKKKMGRMFNQ